MNVTCHRTDISMCLFLSFQSTAKTKCLLHWKPSIYILRCEISSRSDDQGSMVTIDSSIINSWYFTKAIFKDKVHSHLEICATKSGKFSDIFDICCRHYLKMYTFHQDRK